VEWQYKRFVEIDFVRSVAIVIMIVANTFPYLGGFDPSPVFRVTMSFAAPLFIFLTGISSYYRNDRKIIGLVSNLAIISSAVCIDVFVWKIVPFETFDVLYVIGLGGLVQLLLPNRFGLHVILGFLFFSLALVFQFFEFYRFEFEETNLGFFYGIHFSNLLQRLLIDGWFPIFPWMGFAFLGRAFIIKKNKTDAFLKKARLPVLLVFTLLFIIYSNLISTGLRMGYVETFYPANGPYLLMALVWILTILAITPAINKGIPDNFFIMGKFSMTIYVMHAIVNAYGFEKAGWQISGWSYFFAMILLVFAFMIFSLWLDRVSRGNGFARLPIFLRKMLGV
jgi:uncharacterized membrane protein